ncbi:hypothetical protein EJP82_19415 [Paenibacillus anaericanus]|uniref:Uncharacterized protein n=1 Tax=Paenibacillus anaericanus TaxID=170367 RepID=A0A433Y5L6_9BACL|nr:hypothetical protein [Paenibacillus anaericanus]RUT43866.1 hypothetical protein EJP82_19415 [Paenibacillus anaericanus]
MKKRYLWIVAVVTFATLGVCIRLFFFPSYESFTVIQQKELSSSKYGTYVYRGMADQTIYDSKINRKLIGKTQTGDRIVELKNDPANHYLILIFNTEMPWWDLYELDTKEDSPK